MARQMSISVAKASNKTSIEHNNRSMTKSELNKLTHIDQGRLHKNEYLVDISIEEMYEKEFGEALENYNNKQKRKDRKIENYYEHILKSKRHMPQQEIIFQVGDIGDFAHEENRQMAKDILREYFERFQIENPNLKIYNAVIHDDEASPHLHINFVPVADDYKRGLEKQVSFDKALIQQDKNLNVQQPFTEWRANQVLQLEEMLNKKNINRKIVGSFDYKNQKEFKLKKDLDSEILGLRAEKKNVEETLVNESLKLEHLEARRGKLNEIADKGLGNAEKFVKRVLNDVKPIVLNKDNVQIPKKDLDSLKSSFLTVAESSYQAREEHKDLKSDYDFLLAEYKELSAESYELKQQNKYLGRVNEELKGIRDIHSGYNKIFHVFKEYLEASHDDIQNAINGFPILSRHRETLKGFVSACLTDRDLSGAFEVAVFANRHGYNSALLKFNIGSTVQSHRNLQEQNKLKHANKEEDKYLNLEDVKKIMKKSDKKNQNLPKSKGRGR